MSSSVVDVRKSLMWSEEWMSAMKRRRAYAESLLSGYYHAFGKEFGTPHQLKEHLATIKGETGKELHEVGNDSMSSIKKPKKEYDMEKAKKALYEEMRHG